MHFDAYVDQYGCKVQRECGSALRIDSKGRWKSARYAGQMLRRTMDSQVVQLTGNAPFSLQDANSFHDKLACQAAEFAQDLEQGARLRISADPDKLGAKQVIALLRCAATWTPEHYRAEAAKYARTYAEPVEILPPDRYSDLVFLPALGCPNSTCTFCAFYRNRKFRPLSDGSFAAHVDAVAALTEGAEAAQGIFLGSASALSMGQRIVQARLQLLQERFGNTRRGVGAFWDPDHCPERSEAQWQSLRQVGLVAAYLGLETGQASLRAEFGKSADLPRLIRRSRIASDAGVQLGVMVLVGVSAPSAFPEHCQRTADVVEAMKLKPTDLVFISPLRETRPPAQLRSEAKTLRNTLSQCTPAHIAPYAAERFHHYS